MPKKLISFLNSVGAKYTVAEHRTVYTAFDAAATQKTDIKMVGKVLGVKLDTTPAMIILPGDKNLDTNALKKEVNKLVEKNMKSDEPNPLLPTKKIKKINFLSEAQIIKLFDLVKKGKNVKAPAMPFGSLYKMATFIDKPLLKQKKISLPAGSFTESIELTPTTYMKIETPFALMIGKKR